MEMFHQKWQTQQLSTDGYSQSLCQGAGQKNTQFFQQQACEESLSQGLP